MSPVKGTTTHETKMSVRVKTIFLCALPDVEEVEKLSNYLKWVTTSRTYYTYYSLSGQFDLKSLATSVAAGWDFLLITNLRSCEILHKLLLFLIAQLFL